MTIKQIPKKRRLVCFWYIGNKKHNTLPTYHSKPTLNQVNWLAGKVAIFVHNFSIRTEFLIPKFTNGCKILDLVQQQMDPKILQHADVRCRKFSIGWMDEQIFPSIYKIADCCGNFIWPDFQTSVCSIILIKMKCLFVIKQ